MGEAIWDVVNERRAVLARSIGQRFYSTLKLKPVSFRPVPPCGTYLCQHPLDYGGWLFVADRLRTLADDHYHHAIDHEWALARNDREDELWGVVSEPYIGDAEAEGLCKALRRTLDDWGVDVHLLPASDSAWLPDSCRPIVMVLRDGEIVTFLRRTGRAIGEELESMT
jgi:hypothetical protein